MKLQKKAPFASLAQKYNSLDKVLWLFKLAYGTVEQVSAEDLHKYDDNFNNLPALRVRVLTVQGTSMAIIENAAGLHFMDSQQGVSPTYLTKLVGQIDEELDWAIYNNLS